MYYQIFADSIMWIEFMDRVREMSLRSFEIQPRFCFIKKHAGICEFFTVTGDFSDKKQKNNWFDGFLGFWLISMWKGKKTRGVRNATFCHKSTVSGSQSNKSRELFLIHGWLKNDWLGIFPQHSRRKTRG